jgi:hypothetical protein
MRRVIVLGGLGLFGRAAADQLSRLAIRPILASRGASAELRIDANDRESICSVLRKGDLVIDTAGPFQVRTTALVEAAIDVGFDIIDVNDNLAYAEHVLAMEQRITAAGIRVLSAASTVSAVAAAVIRSCGVSAPVRVTAFLAPATKVTANAGSARTLVESVGRPVRLWRDRRMQTRPGWSEPRRFSFPQPLEPVCGRLFETADALILPQIWPTLREVAMHVDTNTPGLNAALRLVGAVPALRDLILRQLSLGTSLARRLGSAVGGVGYEIEDVTGRIKRHAIVAELDSFLVAVAPAVLAAKAIVDGNFANSGLVPPDRQVDPDELFEFLSANRIAVTELD